MAGKSIYKNIEWYKSEFDRFEKQLNGQSKSAVHQIRKNAMSKFVELGFPSTRNEEWKYTNIEPVAETMFYPVHDYKIGSVKKNDLDGLIFSDLDCHKLVFINGHFADDLSDKIESLEKFSVVNFRNTVESDEKRINHLLSQNIDLSSDAFNALSMAFLQDGAVVHLGNNSVIEKPILLIFISTGEKNNTLVHPRNFIIAEKNSKAKIIESYTAINEGKYFTNVATDIILDENANIEHIKLQDESELAFHISSINISQEKGSRFSSFAINLGGKLSRNNISSALNGTGSECTLNGIYIGNQSQHIDNHTVIEHRVSHCTSTELYKGVMNDSARGVFNGKIHVYPDAQKTNAVQSNSGLLLSDSASIDTKPQLEIYADDVRCTHGATIGQLDNEALFYLQSRGIGIDTAKKMLINAFAGEVIDKIELEDVRMEIEGSIKEKMKGNQ